MRMMFIQTMNKFFKAASAFTKSFRFPFIKDIYVYHTLSETDFNLDPKKSSFKPNYFVDITEHFDEVSYYENL